MDPRNYSTQDTNPKVDQSTKTWFDSIDSPNIAPRSPEPKPSGGKWKLILVVLICVVVLGTGGALAFMLTSPAQPQPTASIGKCLDNSQYEKFLGVKNQDMIESQENFYTQSVSFESGKTDYLESEKIATDNFLKKIGAFYQSNHEGSSIVISITSDYLVGQSSQLAQERITMLKQTLVEYGVAEAAISSKEPQQIISEDPKAANVPVIISITSNQKCQEAK